MQDQTHPVLGKRITASKPAKLVVATKAKGKNGTSELAKFLAEQARELSARWDSVGMIVNRVATARELKKLLGDDAVLLTGRMRPVDRDELLATKLQPLLSGETGTSPKFVIGTQCLECGADFDFPALVTECASLDALRQRFGRLNRIAARETCEAVIVIRADQEKDSKEDPVYGKSMSDTWQWLNEKAKGETVDFGITSMRMLTEGEDLSKYNAPAPDAAILLPAHLDCWVQTHPIPTPDPEPALFLHGPQRSSADVQVVFRDGLGEDEALWQAIVALCPPSSTESVSVPIRVFSDWLTGKLSKDDSSDVEGEHREEDEAEQSDAARERLALRWKGAEAKDTEIVRFPREIRPGDTYVLPCHAPDAALLGDFPAADNLPADCSVPAFIKSRDKAILRLREFNVSEDTEDDFKEKLAEAIEAAAQQIPNITAADIRRLVTKKYRNVEKHPLPGYGYVVTGKQRLHQFDPTYLDDSDALESFRGGCEVSLTEHSAGVAKYAQLFAHACDLDESLYHMAGLLHDLGKAEIRFQAKLKHCTPQVARGILLAKSAKYQRGDEALHKYPSHARHELLSAALVATKSDDDLLLHLLATHHGSARPFASFVEENGHATKPFSVALFDQSFSLPSSEQAISDWNPELAERFWRVVRRYGWWGTAYREAIFRLADHTQSREEQEEETDTNAISISTTLNFTHSTPNKSWYPIPLVGLNGMNPLAFLAALGTLRLSNELSYTENKLAWNADLSACLYMPINIASEKLIDLFVQKMPRTLEQHFANISLSLPSDQRPRDSILSHMANLHPMTRCSLDWISSTFDAQLPTATSQLLVVRRDYVEGNFRSILQRTTADHLRRALFETWDYADSLDNQSLHWEPSEDRRHAYQWYQASGDPTRKKRGGMLGANRLALEAWPMFLSVPLGEKLSTRGFTGTRMSNTRWTWPLWSQPQSNSTIESLLSLKILQDEKSNAQLLAANGIFQINRCQRILVGKTPNLTPAYAI